MLGAGSQQCCHWELRGPQAAKARLPGLGSLPHLPTLGQGGLALREISETVRHVSLVSSLRLVSGPEAEAALGTAAREKG